MLKLATITFMAMATTATAADFKVTGKVTNVYPITGWNDVEVVTQECRNVTTNNSAGANALGGMIIGGLIGKGLTGDDKGAAAGAIIGGVIGADKTKPGQTTRRVCQDVTSIQRQEAVKYYVVEYNWNGYTGEFQTQYNNHYVGQKVQLNLTLTRF